MQKAQRAQKIKNSKIRKFKNSKTFKIRKFENVKCSRIQKVKNLSSVSTGDTLSQDTITKLYHLNTPNNGSKMK